MSTYSPWSVSESAPPKWSPGEELAASGFVALIFYLVLDINISILPYLQEETRAVLLEHDPRDFWMHRQWDWDLLRIFDDAF